MDEEPIQAQERAPHALWDRLPNEPAKWYRRFERFRLMEPIRSIVDTFLQEESVKNRENPRKKPTGDWYEQAKKWRWVERATAWDDYQDKQLEQRILAEQKKILSSRYALMHERIKLLDEKTEQLRKYSEDENNIWLSGAKGEILFNDGLFRELRAHLDDIAKEKGERIKASKQELTGKDGGPVEVNNAVQVHVFYPHIDTEPDFEEMSDDELQAYGKG